MYSNVEEILEVSIRIYVHVYVYLYIFTYSWAQKKFSGKVTNKKSSMKVIRSLHTKKKQLYTHA